jgi:hypothetical protein
MVKVENGIAMISDFDNIVVFNTDLADGMYTVLNGETFIEKNVKIDDYPMTPTNGEVLEKAVISAMFIVEHALCVANDQLRPVMNGIHLNAEHMVASDAHVLKYTPVESIGETTPGMNIIFAPSSPLIARIKAGDEAITIKTFEDDNRVHARFEFSDCTIIQRLVEGNYPNYKGITPDWKKEQMQCFSMHTETISEMVKFGKAVTRELMVVRESQMIISNLDMGLAKSWQAPENVPFPDTEPAALLMPMAILDSVEDPTARVGLSPKKLQQIVGSHKGTVTIGFYDPTRPMAVWLNQEKHQAIRKPAPAKKEQAPAKPAPQPAPQATQPEPKEQPQAPAPQMPEGTGTSILILPYSDKAIAVFNAPESFKDIFKECWGRYNKYLKHPESGQTLSGWIFSKKRTEQIKEIVLKAS